MSACALVNFTSASSLASNKEADLFFPFASAVRVALPILIATASAVRAQDGQSEARGVNPADIDTRFDTILKYNWLKGGGGIFTTTLKFDYRISSELGFNLETPVFGSIHMPARPGIPGSAVDDAGIGDVFARLRYVKSLGRLSVGGAVETTLPMASEKTLGSGTYQLNVAGLAVYAWSPSVITAVVAKASQSIYEFNGRARVQENSVRAIQAFVLPQGRFLTFDLKYNWETINRRDRWWEAQVEAGMMVSAQSSVSVALSRKFGDRADRGAIAATVKRFF